MHRSPRLLQTPSTPSIGPNPTWINFSFAHDGKGLVQILGPLLTKICYQDASKLLTWLSFFLWRLINDHSQYKQPPRGL